MAKTQKANAPVAVGTYRKFRYQDLKPNPLNPRRLFDQEPLDTLKESIKQNGILVPLTVYVERNGQHYILDGERRWRCAEAISTDRSDPRKVPIPANVVDPPDKVANILWMFNIHNLREQWELMPAALSLKLVMDELGESDERRLAHLTQMSEPNVRRCKLLLSFPKKYQQMMLAPDADERVKANFFIELAPVLELYETLGKRRRGGKERNELTDHFLAMYRAGNIPSVINFRRILEAHDLLKDDDAKYDDFLAAAQQLATDSTQTIRKLFDPLVAEDKSVATATELCKDFLRRLRNLKISHSTKGRSTLQKQLKAIKEYVESVLTDLEG